MDFSNDELRRQLRAARADQHAAVRGWRELLQRVLGNPATTSDERAGVVLGGLPRRRFLAVGGFSVATAAVLAACGTEETGIPETGLPGTTTTEPPRAVTDVVLLRTASSLEYSAIGAYEAALGLGVLDASLSQVAELFQDQHREHAELMEAATRELGGEPYSKPNPAVEANVVAPALALLEEVPEADLPEAVLRIAHALESVAAGTYQSVVPSLSKPALRQAAMSIGAVEARHATVLAGVIPGSAPVPPPPGATPDETTSTAPGGDIVALTPVYQVPEPFGSLAPVALDIRGVEVQIPLPGPNSLVYDFVE